MKINKKSKIFIAGHNGMVGSSLCRKFNENGFKNILTVEKKKVNLLDQKAVFKFLKKNKPDLVIIAAARAGGIYANLNYKAKFIYENLEIQNNLIHGSYLAGIKKLFFLGSSCIYPKYAKQPIKENYLLTSSLEPTNDAYALAKISGLMMCKYYSENYKVEFKSLMPCNLYGPGDNYHDKDSHFFPALIKKILSAKKKGSRVIRIWGSGKPKRELLYVDDLSSAVLFLINKKIKEPFINIGSGKDQTINWYANFIINYFQLNLKIKFDRSKPDGVPRKLLDISIIKKLGWKAQTTLKNGLSIVIKDFLKNNT